MLKFSFRLLGALFLFLLGWQAGCQLSGKAAAHRAELDMLVHLLERLSDEIEYRRKPMEDILLVFQNDPEFASFLSGCSSMQAAQPPKDCTQREKALFCECFQGLGHSPAESECRRIEYYHTCFLHFAADAAEQEKSAKRIYPRLGLGAGAILAILVL